MDSTYVDIKQAMVCLRRKASAWSLPGQSSCDVRSTLLLLAAWCCAMNESCVRVAQNKPWLVRVFGAQGHPNQQRSREGRKGGRRKTERQRDRDRNREAETETESMAWFVQRAAKPNRRTKRDRDRGRKRARQRGREATDRRESGTAPPPPQTDGRTNGGTDGHRQRSVVCCLFFCGVAK